MASAYKSIGEDGTFTSDSEESDASQGSGSSNTLQAESVPAIVESTLRHAPVSALSAEIKNRVLMLTTRGISYRHRHLLNDLHILLPHTKKDSKLDSKSSGNYNSALNALADLHSCNYVFLLEARKHGQDLYLWLARAPNGPTIKFSVSNVHTMGELGFGGNCLKGGRGVVVFDKSFEDGFEPGLEYNGLIREMLAGVFSVPARGVRGMKPFVDRIVGIFGLDGKIWIRVYEISEAEKKSTRARLQDSEHELEEKDSDISLVEIGPRFVLTPIVIQEASFSGPVLFENKEYVSANQIRSEARLQKASKYARRRGEAQERVIRKGALGLGSGTKRRKGVLDNLTLFV